MMFASQYELCEWVFVRASEDRARSCSRINVCKTVYSVIGCSCVRLRTARDRVRELMCVRLCTV